MKSTTVVILIISQLLLIISTTVANPIRAEVLGLDDYFKPVPHTYSQCFGRLDCMDQLIQKAQNVNVTWVGVRLTNQ